MIYTDCEDATIVRQMIELCQDSPSLGFINTSPVVERVAGDNPDLFTIYYYANLALVNECRIVLR